MQADEIVTSLGALAHETRLSLFRLLVQRGPEGLPAGVIADRLGIAPSSLTFHLQQLVYAGLITQRRMSRQIIYATDFERMNRVVAYLTENCCGDASSCAPVCRPQADAPAGKAKRRSA